MRAFLDTNVIIHLYKAGLQKVLFDVFDEDVFIYEQIRNVELENHGRDVLEVVDADIASGKIEIYTDQKLKDQAVYKIFENNFKENMMGTSYHIEGRSPNTWRLFFSCEPLLHQLCLDYIFRVFIAESGFQVNRMNGV